MSHRRLGHRFGVSQSTINRNLKKRTSLRIYRNTRMKINNNEQNSTVQKLSPDCQLILDKENYFLHWVVMFLKIADITHLIIHQHQRTLNSNENKNMKHMSWFVLQSPLEEFLAPTFIVRRLLYVFKTMCIRGLLLLPFIKMTEFSFGLNSHYPIVPLRCCTV